MHRVEITGWREGLRKISLTEALREHAGLGLAEAKASTDRLLDGIPVTVEVPTRAAAVALAGHLNKLGAEAVVRDPGDAV